MKFLLIVLFFVLFGVFVVFVVDFGYLLDVFVFDGCCFGGMLVESCFVLLLVVEENKDLKCECNYFEQLLIIFYSIVGYCIDKDSNKCLFCYSCVNSV